MKNWLKTTSKATGKVNKVLDDAKQTVASSLGIGDPLKILPFWGYGTPNWIRVMGRVLEDEGIESLEEGAPVYKNVQNMYRRFETDEVPNAQVEMRMGDVTQVLEANSEGIFSEKIKLDTPLTAEDWSQEKWCRSVELQLAEPSPRKQETVSATAKITIVPETANFGVISDIDDTIVYTAADRPVKMVKIAYLGNEHSRLPFEGVDEYYNALQAGASGKAGNPIFYVSSSPLNMYDLFAKFMAINDIPNGPILLRDIELSPANLLSFEHGKHKREQIDPLFSNFPDLSFILIGDSGQQDPAIYQKIVEDYPNRVLAVYIRNAQTTEEKRREVVAIAEEIRAAGVDCLLFSETRDVVKHSYEQGWISEMLEFSVKDEDWDKTD